MSARLQFRAFCFKPQFPNLSRKRGDYVSLMGTLVVAFLRIYIIPFCLT